MKIAVIAGSQRAGSNSERAAHLLARRLPEAVAGAEPEVISLANDRLPFWNSDFSEPSERFQAAWTPISQTLAAAEAVIAITPEWAGMASPALKNLLLMCSNYEVAHKPGLIVSISTGTGGAYPVAELRMSGTKNNHLCWLPDHLILRQFATLAPALEAAWWAGAAAHDVARRVDYTLTLLAEYAVALGAVRRSGRLDFTAFPNGL
ncbi:MAG: NADPH-dependent oxidoreductase [Alphaproteobacteria bacterium]|nr:MAG: NADPH-dependent oxidoreductase [Alphaproteobacteria bacterium]